MGRSTKSKYAVHYTLVKGGLTPESWNSKQAGRPTAANLAKHVALLEASTQPGGVNAHCGPMKVLVARLVVNEYGGAVVAEYRADEVTPKLGPKMTKWLSGGSGK